MNSRNRRSIFFQVKRPDEALRALSRLISVEAGPAHPERAGLGRVTSA